MSSLRTQARRSLLALLTAYLRDGITAPTSFTAVSGVSFTYAFTQNVWAFSLGTELYQITMGEAADTPLATGVTVLFANDRALDSRAMPQPWEVLVKIIIRVPRPLIGDSQAQQIAQKIDEALHRSTGHTEIKDYDAANSPTTNTYLTWQAYPRGLWNTDSSEAAFDVMTLEFTASYTTPSL